jgi:hypothetical protein
MSENIFTANASSQDPKRCRLNVPSLAADQMGTWRCKVDFADVDTYRVVFFTATTAVRVSDIRLPRHLVPERYVVFLTPFLVVNNFTIQGHVDIQANAVAEGANITLHVQVGRRAADAPSTPPVNAPVFRT